MKGEGRRVRVREGNGTMEAGVREGDGTMEAEVRVQGP